MSKDIRQLVRNLEKAGFTVDRTRNNHLRVTRNGEFVTVLPSKPNDHRAIKNAMARLRKFGYRP